MKKDKKQVLVFITLVLVFFILLNIIFSFRNSSSRKSEYESYKIKGTYLVRAGIMKMLVEFTRDTNSYDSLNEDWNRDKKNPKKLILKKDTIFYGASDESARLNLNGSVLREENLIRLGIDTSLAKEILEYRNKKSSKSFEFIEELFLIEGMKRDVFSKIEDFVTIYRGFDPKVNINTASRDVLTILGMDEPLIDLIIEFRNGDDELPGTEDDRFFPDEKQIVSTLTTYEPIYPDELMVLQNLVSQNQLGVKSEYYTINSHGYVKDLSESTVISATVDNSEGKRTIKRWQVRQ